MLHRDIHKLIAITVMLLICVNNSVANTDSQSHCNDKIRDLVMDSCRAISLAYNKQRHQDGGISSDIVKREAIEEDEADFDVKFLSSGKEHHFLENHHMFLVRHHSYPGVHLILNHRNAKILKEFDSDYKMHPYKGYVYRNEDGKLVRDLIRGKRNNHRYDIKEKIAVCCASEISCKVALCFARSRL